MKQRKWNAWRIDGSGLLPAAFWTVMPVSAWAQTSPFDTGANSLVDFGLTIATPIAILIVIGAGIAAAVGKISWGWVIGGIIGIAVVFGSEQVVTWIRGLFGV